MLNFDAVFLSLRQKTFFQFIVKNNFGNTAVGKKLNTYFNTFHFKLQLITVQGDKTGKRADNQQFCHF